MKKASVILMILFTMLASISCSANGQQLSNDMPDIEVKAENWNTSIKLTDDPMLSNSFKNGEDLTLRVGNLSNISITFPENFDVRVMTKNGDNWVDIQNNFYNSGTQYLPTKASYPLGLLVTTIPYIPNLSTSTIIRIVIIGHAEDNDKESVGAYLDVTLNP